MATGSMGGIGRWRIAGWGVAALLLLLPAIAMRFTTEVNWTASDFVFAGIMFALVGGALELAVRATPSRAYRAGAAAAILTAFLLVWIYAAVGIIGDEGDPRNRLYAAVLGTMLLGAIVARFRAAGMARAMTAAALVQALVGTFAVVAGRDQPPGAFGLAILNGGFVVLLLGAAWLFRRAARDWPNADHAGRSRG